MTIPTILRKRAGYDTALFGKQHHANGNRHEFDTTPYGGLSATQGGGFNSFYGFAGIPSIDTTAGGVGPESTYGCGYVPSTAINSTTGADSGACYFEDDRCTAMTLSSSYQSPGMYIYGTGFMSSLFLQAQLRHLLGTCYTVSTSRSL